MSESGQNEPCHSLRRHGRSTSDCMSPSILRRGLPGLAGQSLKQGGRVVNQHSRAFVGIDTSKLRNAVAVAEDGRDGDVRYLGEIDTTEAATRKLVTKLAAKYRQLTFCYEAGPTGYGLYRLIRKLGHDCIVAAPSLIPKKPGDRVKTNRRDAVGLAKLSRAGELTAVWVPDERHEGCEISRAPVRQREKTSKATANKSPRSCFGSGDIIRAKRRGGRPT